MKIAVLQFNPRLGEQSQNIARADSLLSTNQSNLDLLVLPELAFSGYNFPSLSAITPFLEPTTSGPTTQWASRVAQTRNCTVIVGYPEICTNPDGSTTNYNSTVTVGPQGEILANYRKSFLYYTDETWATEGFKSSPNQSPFFAGQLGRLGLVGHGICMDINPHRFEAPWTDYEFANTMLRNGCKLIVLSMAWLTRLTPEDTEAHASLPDMETVAYWLERFWPFQEARSQEPIVVVFANRCGSEGVIEGERVLEHGSSIELGNRVAYAGSSCVMKFQGGSVKLWEHFVGPNKGEVGLLGKGEEAVLVIDTGSGAGFLLQQKAG
ncbi:related to amino-terminal amidase [Ramularia collo-cygni]|uniref:Related to amino-terminal amidase n=1 Tax=Ramularia collo-cygni TaxID=112498 RepID=A0A2D3VI90_9PEZI|nr:related to amino-terminal amidase [Ramularia collo-cygni]CZT21709.1 related to amino-terminal amidase [Ramularia collo-cygni]